MSVGEREPIVDLALAREHGLSESEYATLLGFLGRTPTWTELGVTSALWSEHCSYKSSKIYLREFPSSGPRVLQGPGENAGAVDIGHGWVAVFKMESHNHPSYIEPYQGAATGVGGILRDVFTMGARPIACLDSLHFGRIDAPRMRGLVDGVVRGIGDYGNCVGIPTVGGATQFHPCYDGNILVNAFALGVALRVRHEPEDVAPSVADTGDGPRRPVEVPDRIEAAGGIDVAKHDLVPRLELVQCGIEVRVVALAVGDRQPQHLTDAIARGVGEVVALDAQEDIATLEASTDIAAQRPRQQARFGEHLEAVADAQDQAAPGRVLPDRAHHRRDRRQRAAAQVVTEGPASGQDDKIAALEAGLLVPQVDHLLPEHMAQDVVGVVITVRTREDDHTAFHDALTPESSRTIS